MFANDVQAAEQGGCLLDDKAQLNETISRSFFPPTNLKSSADILEIGCGITGSVYVCLFSALFNASSQSPQAPTIESESIVGPRRSHIMFISDLTDQSAICGRAS